MSGDHSDYRNIKIGQNTEKNPGDLNRLAVSQVENHQQMLVGKTLKIGLIIIIIIVINVDNAVTEMKPSIT